MGDWLWVISCKDVQGIFKRLPIFSYCFLHFLVQACKRGNYDIVRLMIENGADCNISSKHQSNAIHFAKQCNNLLVYELLRNHLAT